jgi:predicted deacylase
MTKLVSNTFNSNIQGPKLLVLGAIHGNEPAGTIASNKIMQQIDAGEIKLLKGSIEFIPVCNPIAKDKDVRFIEHNLNRILNRHEKEESVEHSFANQVCDAIDRSDYVLDIHSTHLEGDLPTVFNDFVTDETSAWANTLNIGTVITSWRDMLNNSEAPSDFSDTVNYAHQQGKKALLIEAGYHYEPTAENLAYQAIYNSLVFLGMIDSSDNQEPKNDVAHMYKVVFKTNEEGSFVKNWKHMDTVTAGEVVAKLDNGTELKAEFDGYVVIPFPTATAGEEWFYLAKK